MRDPHPKQEPYPSTGLNKCFNLTSRVAQELLPGGQQEQGATLGVDDGNDAQQGSATFAILWPLCSAGRQTDSNGVSPP